jgi:hypothetical protein
MKRIVFLAFLIYSIKIQAQNVGINTAAPNAALDVYGEIALKSAEIQIVDALNYALNVAGNKFSNYKLKGAPSNFVLAGINGGVDGYIVTLHNRTGFIMSVYHQDATAALGHRIHTSNGNTLEVYNNGNVTLQYDGEIQSWQVITKHHSNLDFTGGGGTGLGWAENGTEIYNTNTGNVGIGINNASRAKFEVNGTSGTGLTSAILGGDGTGLSFQRNWPTIGFNQYRDNPLGWGKAIASGYGAHMFLDPNIGAFAMVMQDSAATDASFIATPKRAFTIFKNGYMTIGNNNINDQATLTISGDDNYPSHFNYGPLGHTYIRGGDREHRTIGVVQFRPSKVYINDVPGINYLTNTQYPGGDVILALGGGAVGIGTENTTGYKLAVNGFIRAKEIRVNTGWADYVFDDTYKLRSLTDVEEFIQKNKHLPDIPPAAELQKNGVDISAIQTKMMAKIEELTLYLIEANKKIEALEKLQKKNK